MFISESLLELVFTRRCTGGGPPSTRLPPEDSQSKFITHIATHETNKSIDNRRTKQARNKKLKRQTNTLPY